VALGSLDLVASSLTFGKLTRKRRLTPATRATSTNLVALTSVQELNVETVLMVDILVFVTKMDAI
jgi:hypothetical protein